MKCNPRVTVGVLRDSVAMEIPISPSVPHPTSLGNLTHSIGFDSKVVIKKGILRKTVDYGASFVRLLEVSLASCDMPLCVIVLVLPLVDC